jgi:hypothetical protein
MPTKLDRIQIDYTLQFLTPFHCGTGTRVGLIDRTVARDSNDYFPVSLPLISRRKRKLRAPMTLRL